MIGLHFVFDKFKSCEVDMSQFSRWRRHGFVPIQRSDKTFTTVCDKRALPFFCDPGRACCMLGPIELKDVRCLNEPPKVLIKELAGEQGLSIHENCDA